MQTVDIGSYLSEYFRNSGLTYDELAEISGVSKTTCHAILNNSRREASVQNVAALCRALAVSMDDMFGLTKPEDVRAERIAMRPSEETLHKLLDHHNTSIYTMTLRHDARIARKDRTILRQTRIIILFAVAEIIKWLVDFMVPSRGWIIRNIGSNNIGLEVQRIAAEAIEFIQRLFG
ncbi:MAG: helix-turn-helix transcriptional regulator [Clostridia bacterium]|nr:helix-turn-helix transcriptional regulator [Clostridia bacterium]